MTYETRAPFKYANEIAFLIEIKMHVAKRITGVWLEVWGLFLLLFFPSNCVWGTALGFRSPRDHQFCQLLGLAFWDCHGTSSCFE